MEKKKHILDTRIEMLKGVGPQKADVLKKELGFFTFRDLLYHFPFRYVDKTKFHRIADINTDKQPIQLKGILRRLTVQGEGRKRRLVATFRDESGAIELIWFKGVHWLQQSLKVGAEYVVYGTPSYFARKYNIAHPEIEPVSELNTKQRSVMEAVYSTTEKLKAKGLDSRGMLKLIKTLLKQIPPESIKENIPEYIMKKLDVPSRYNALIMVHLPRNYDEIKKSTNRLKFEELFFLQLRLLQSRGKRKKASRGHVFDKVGDFFMGFFNEKLPFELTGAQKRVVKEIRRDMGQGRQMNRLLQGDVGSGKTIVALFTMLLALDNGFQACLMAPTEILAQQHYISLQEMTEGLGINIGFLSGSIKGKKRQALLEALADNDIHILIGTHALIEPPVVFHNMGLAIIDEQHRFGVEQRAKLWKKSKVLPPHILVMTATPIPRTLSMTLYGDLHVSIIDELPPGRKPVETVHMYDTKRLRMIGEMRKAVAKGHQVYVVYPMIEDSPDMELRNLEQGYGEISEFFPAPDYAISIVHGKMKPKDKDFEMKRFVKGETQIMVATTVIEVGVNVPNATLMVIENTERFGLSQLHQLRGRVGRGGDQANCILMSDFKLSKEGRTRIETMCRTNDGFEIAEVDMQIRGPGNIEGKQQSGMLHLKIADLAKDGRILQTAREIAMRILENDLKLEQAGNIMIKRYLEQEYNKKGQGWSQIS